MNLIMVAASTIEACENGCYPGKNGDISFQDALDFSVKNTKYISPDDQFKFEKVEEVKESVIEITDETTDSAGRRLAKDGDVVILNFADAVGPGGGFLKGARAQEECLCRASGLFFCLKRKDLQKSYYAINEQSLFDNDKPKDRLIRNLYTDGIIYSPKVPFIKDENYNWLETPVNLSVITCPAPYCSEMKNEEERTSLKIVETILSRIDRILTVAAAYGYKQIILGAFGCGAFGNSPELVATVFKDTLKEFKCFEKVIFAIPNKESKNYQTFKKVFSE